MKKIIIYIFASLFFASSSISGITFWTTEVQPARMAKQQDMAKDFESKTGISVEVIPVEEKDLGKRATAAAAAGVFVCQSGTDSSSSGINKTKGSISNLIPPFSSPY